MFIAGDRYYSKALGVGMVIHSTIDIFQVKFLLFGDTVSVQTYDQVK